MSDRREAARQENSNPEKSHSTHGVPGRFDLVMAGEQPEPSAVTWADERKIGV